VTAACALFACAGGPAGERADGRAGERAGRRAGGPAGGRIGGGTSGRAGERAPTHIIFKQKHIIFEQKWKLEKLFKIKGIETKLPSYRPVGGKSHLAHLFVFFGRPWQAMTGHDRPWPTRRPAARRPAARRPADPPPADLAARRPRRPPPADPPPADPPKNSLTLD